MPEYQPLPAKPAALMLAWATGLTPIWITLTTIGTTMWLNANSVIASLSDTPPNTGLAITLLVIGLATLAIACTLATIGVWRLISHADRTAGVTYKKGYTAWAWLTQAQDGH